jgi:hypothetical protein
LERGKRGKRGKEGRNNYLTGLIKSRYSLSE